MKKLIISSLAFGALTLGGGSVTAGDVYLCAGQVNKTLSDSTVVPMWGFAEVANAAAQVPGCSAAATVPGPQLVNRDGGATPGLNVHVYNDSIPEPISIIIPGQSSAVMTPVFFPPSDPNYANRLRSFTHETAPGAIATYSWPTLEPGTYAYQSGTHQSVQIQMGLYGAMIKDAVVATPATIAEAYTGVAYDASIVLFYSEIDADLHDAVAAGDYGPGSTIGMTSTVNYKPQYFLLNGEDIPSSNMVGGTAGDTVLIRMINMGLRNHAPMFQGLTVGIIAEDGNPYPYAKNQYSVFLAAGKTKDAVFTTLLGGNYAFLDRRLFLTNKKNTSGIGVLATGSAVTTQTPGTLINYIEVAAAVVDTDGDGVADEVDNCTLVANVSQFDADNDGFGNPCDPDLNNDMQVNTGDFNLFRTKLFTKDSTADFNEDGNVDTGDLNILRSYLFKAPGPAGSL